MFPSVYPKPRGTSITQLITIAREEIQYEGTVVEDDGTLTFTEEVSEEQLIETARRLTALQGATSTIFNFMIGDLWVRVAGKYGGGKDFLIRAFGEANWQKRMHFFAPKAVIARAVPREQRDLTKSWTWYKRHYQRKRVPRKVDTMYRPKHGAIDADGKPTGHKVSVSRDYLVFYSPEGEKTFFPLVRVKDDLLRALDVPVEPMPLPQEPVDALAEFLGEECVK